MELNFKFLCSLGLITILGAIIDRCHPTSASPDTVQRFVQHCPMHTETDLSRTPRLKTDDMYNFSQSVRRKPSASEITFYEHEQP